MPRPSTTRARFSHIGLCVDEVARAMAFYTAAFGFADGRALEIVNDQHDLLGVAGDYRLDSHFLRLDGLVLELLGFEGPSAEAGSRPRPMYRPGFTHLSLNVDGLEAAIADVEAAGGRVLKNTHTLFDLEGVKGEIVFVTDLEGNRIELMSFPEDVVNA